MAPKGIYEGIYGAEQGIDGRGRASMAPRGVRCAHEIPPGGRDLRACRGYPLPEVHLT